MARAAPIRLRTEDRQASALRALAICFAIVFVDGYDLQSIGFLAPEIARQWSLPLSDFGIVFGAGLTGTIPGAFFAGLASSRLGRARSLGLAIAIMACGTASGALVNGVASLAVCRFIGGIGMGAAFPLAMSIVADAAPSERRASYTMVLLAGQALGLVFGAASCSRLLPVFGWQSGFWLGGVLSAALLPLILLLPNRTPDRPCTTPEGDGHFLADEHVLSPAFRRLTFTIWIAAILATLETLLIVNWLPGLLREMGYGLNETLLASSLISGSGVCGSIILGLLIDRYGPFRTIPVAYGVGAAAIIGLLWSYHDHRLSFAICVGIGLGVLGAGTSIGSLTVSYFPPRLRASSAGYALALGRASAAICSVLVGRALAGGSDRLQILSLAALIALLAALNVLLLRNSGIRMAQD